MEDGIKKGGEGSGKQGHVTAPMEVQAREYGARHERSLKKSEYTPDLLYKAQDRPYQDDINDLIEKGGPGSGKRGHTSSESDYHSEYKKIHENLKEKLNGATSEHRESHIKHAKLVLGNLNIKHGKPHGYEPK